jgi:hypothetical protein
LELSTPKLPKLKASPGTSNIMLRTPEPTVPKDLAIIIIKSITVKAVKAFEEKTTKMSYSFLNCFINHL